MSSRISVELEGHGPSVGRREPHPARRTVEELHRQVPFQTPHLLADGGLRAQLGTAGKAYVDTHYRWPTLIERYRTFLESMA